MDSQEESIKPMVTIIIPCYNYGRYISETLQSLQKQNFSNWECWVIDDGSTDSTDLVVKEMAARDRRINYSYQKNQGQPAARNTGLQKANGYYIQFLDADDLLEPMKIDRQLNYFNYHPDADIVYGPVCYFDSKETTKLFVNRWDEQMEEWMPKLSGKGLPMIEAFVNQNILELGSALFRKSAVHAIGYFNTDLQGVEDYDYCFRAATEDLCFAYMDEENTRCLMRHHADSFSKNIFQMFKKELILRRFMTEKIEKSGHPELQSLNRNRYALRLRRLQDLVIDETIKGKKNHFNANEMKWIFNNSNLKQNLYFFPRMFKAFITAPVLNNR